MDDIEPCRKGDPRASHRYTPYFCEENIWWLLAEMRDRGRAPDTSSVLLFSNADASIVVFQQRAAAPGAPMAWDYHVVLSVPADEGLVIYDFDTRLPFPCPQRQYLTATFPDQRRLPARWRSRVRKIPGDAYLDRFCSDRSHMRGRLPAEAFPDSPMICPRDRDRAIQLAAYRDMERRLDDGSSVLSIDALVAATSRATGQGRE